MRRRDFSVAGLFSCLMLSDLLLINLLLINLLLTSACASKPKLTSANLEYAQDLTMMMASGKKIIQDYHSKSVVKSFVANKAPEVKTEIVDFTVQSDFKPSDGQSASVVAEVTTTRKNGATDLHDLAFPELNETIPFVFGPQGNVKRAGSFDRSGLFYVPPISLPEEPAKVGDTWTMKHKWLSQKAGLPLQISVVTILKDFYKCAESTCAELEISGNVEILGLKEGEIKFSSEVRGTILFALEIGQPVWLNLGSSEFFQTKDKRVEVKSCLVSATTDPVKLIGYDGRSLGCDTNLSEPLRAADYWKSFR